MYMFTKAQHSIAHAAALCSPPGGGKGLVVCCACFLSLNARFLASAVLSHRAGGKDIKQKRSRHRGKISIVGQAYDLLKNQLPRLELAPSVCWIDWIVGTTGGASPPPPRRGLAILLPALAKLNPPPPPPVALSPRVLPAFAASKRSLTEAS